MTVTYRLYMELIFAAAVILAVLLVNNIFLYKQKITNLISLMVLSAFVMTCAEILWAVFEGHPELAVPSYIAAGIYNVTLTLFAVFFNQYYLSRFDLHPGKVVSAIIYGLPVIAVALVCITTPWTRLAFWVDEKGVVQEMTFFKDVFPILMYIYVFMPIFIALFFLTVGKKWRSAKAVFPYSLFIFGAIFPVLSWLEGWFLTEENSTYEIVTLPAALALMYLITNESTRIAMETQANMDAVETDLRIASKIQEDALPATAPQFKLHPYVKLSCSMNTAREVGGDFYDYFPLDDDRLCFLIADVSGKGTPAALFMMTVKTMIKDYALTHDSTAEIFTEVNTRLCENNDEGMFATAWIGILNARTKTFQFTNAGHNYPILQRQGQPCEELATKHGLFLAGVDGIKYKQDEIPFETGDRLLLFTDGVTEAHNQKGELYGTERLINVIENNRDAAGEELLSDILVDISSFANGAPQFDDITMMVLTMEEDTHSERSIAG